MNETVTGDNQFGAFVVVGGPHRHSDRVEHAYEAGLGDGGDRLDSGDAAGERQVGAHEFGDAAADQRCEEASQTGGPLAADAAVNAKGAAPALGTHICDVEVDPDTGKVDVIRYTVCQDAGRALHKSYVEGQMQGGAVQGIGWALNEEYLFDKDGVMENAGFLDYRMPVTLDLPMIDTVVVEVPNPRHPYGIRGVGENAIVQPLAAIANAIYDAVGVRLYEVPMSPPKVLKALQDAKATRHVAAAGNGAAAQPAREPEPVTAR